MTASDRAVVLRAPTLACPDCSLEQSVPMMSVGMVADCRRCGCTLERRAGSDLDAALAFAATGLLLLIPSNVLVLIQIKLEGAQRQDWIASSSTALWDQGYQLLGVLVGAFTVVAPPLWLTGLLVVLVCVRFDLPQPWLGLLFRWVLALRTWAMADVFLVGSIIAYTRLKDYALVDIGPGGWVFVAAALTILAVDPCLDRRSIWASIGPDAETALERTDFACMVCDRRCTHAEEGHPCPRCGAALHRRKPFSIPRATALLAAGYLLYLPAMALPVMTLVRVGRAEPNTIISGARELITLGLWPLAVIVFVASIAIPLVKLAGMTWFLVAVRRGSAARLVARTKLYRMIELIGRWSNIDVFMISILAALVHFGEFSSVRAEPGVVAFAGVVIVTMLASHSFDPRLMWDAAGDAA